MGKKTPIKFNIPKKRQSWLTVLGGGQACRSATHSRSGWSPMDDFVTKERKFGDTENTLGGVEQDAVRLEFSEEGAEMLVVFLGGTSKDKDVIYIGETEIQVFQDHVHGTVEGLGGVSQAKGHVRKFQRAETCGDSCLLDVIRVDRNFIVSPHEVDFGKGGAARKAVGIILYVWTRYLSCIVQVLSDR